MLASTTKRNNCMVVDGICLDLFSPFDCQEYRNLSGMSITVRSVNTLKLARITE